jgi:hypothetical protein
MKISVVTTAVTVPKNFLALHENAQKYGRDNVEFTFIGDNKTPIEDCRNELNHIPNLDVWPIERQKSFIRESFGEKYNAIFKENNYQRRTIGFIIAHMNGADITIIMDDDNFPRDDEDFFDLHEVGIKKKLTSVSSNVGYINTCDFLDLNQRVFVRGFPLKLRQDIKYSYIEENERIVSNIGLWSLSPDICAIDHYSYPKLEVKEQNLTPLMIGKGNYASYTVQNISFYKDLLPCQFEFPMGDKINNVEIGRFDDIAPGLMLKKIVDEMDDRIAFGPPQAVHVRHLHNIPLDVIREHYGMYIIEWLLAALSKIVLEEEDYFSLTTELVDKLKKTNVDYQPVRKYLMKTLENYSLWLELINKL